jgi:hypothetical protein
MAKLSSSGVTITLDDSGGTPRAVTAFVLTMGGLKITQEMMTSTAYGDTWVQTVVTGIRKGEKIALSGLVDTTADTGTFATMIQTDADAVPGFTRTLAVGVGGGKTFTAEVILESGSIEPKVGLATYSAELQPSGACAWS